MDTAGTDPVNHNDSDVADGVGSGLHTTNETASHVWFSRGLGF